MNNEIWSEIMINKKLIIVLLFLSSVLLTNPISIADEEQIRIIQGAVYINGEPDSDLTESGLKIKIEVSDGQEEIIETVEYSEDDNLNFGKGFVSIAEDETVNFSIKIDGIYQEPFEITLDGDVLSDGYLTITSKTIYHVNLYYTADSPYNPYPVNKSKNIKIDKNLSWDFDESGKSDIVYNVNFDTDTPPSYLDNTTNKTIDPGDLAYNTTYYWMINVSTDDGFYESDIWNFRTITDPHPMADAGGPYSGVMGDTITFDASDSSDDGDITGYRWDWTNDGTWDTDWLDSSTTTHIYSSEFTGKVKVMVKNEDGYNDTDTSSVLIDTDNNPPTVDLLEGPENTISNTSLLFNFSATDLDGDRISYTIDWGDGSSVTTATGASGVRLSETHTYTSSGWYTITLTASDSNEGEGTDTLFLIITDKTNDASLDEGGFPWLYIIIIVVIIAIAGVLFYLYQKGQLPIGKKQSYESTNNPQSNTGLLSNIFQRNKQSSTENQMMMSQQFNTMDSNEMPKPIQSKQSDTTQLQQIPQPLSSESSKSDPDNSSEKDSKEVQSEFKRL